MTEQPMLVTGDDVDLVLVFPAPWPTPDEVKVSVVTVGGATTLAGPYTASNGTEASDGTVGDWSSRIVVVVVPASDSASAALLALAAAGLPVEVEAQMLRGTRKSTQFSQARIKVRRGSIP